MLGENRARGAVVFADVLEDRVVAVLLGMVVDHQVHAVQPFEIVRLHVHQGDSVEVIDRLARERFDADVQQVRHAQVLGARHPFERADHGGGFRAVENRA